MFQFPAFPSYYYVFIARYIRIAVCGFPHSDICGSMDMCSSPQLFAAYHVLLRLPVPRHPPDALVNLTINLPATRYRRTFHYCFTLVISGFSTNSTSLKSQIYPFYCAYLDSLSNLLLLVLFNFQGTQGFSHSAFFLVTSSL